MNDTHYRRICDPTAPHRQARNGGDCDVSCFVPVEGLIDPTQVDPLAAAIGYGIDLQEAIDIVALAVGGRDGLSEFKQTLYDKAAFDEVKRALNTYLDTPNESAVVLDRLAQAYVRGDVRVNPEPSVAFGDGPQEYPPVKLG